MADLNAMLRMEQVEGMDQTIADQLGEIRTTNQKRKALNQLLAKMRQHKSENRDDDTWSNMTTAQNSESFSLEGYGGPKDVQDWMDHFGITRTNVIVDANAETRDGQWDANINAVKSQIDNITSDSEMQMLRFRQMVDKRGTALQEAKTTLSNDKRLKDTIVQG